MANGCDKPDAVAAVVAHGLINTLSIVIGSAATLRESWDDLAPDSRAELLLMIEKHSRSAMGSLVGLVKGMPPEVIDVLDQLAADRTSDGLEGFRRA